MAKNESPLLAAAKAPTPLRIDTLRIVRRSRRRKYATRIAFFSALVGLHHALTYRAGWVISDEEVRFALSVVITPLAAIVALVGRGSKPFQVCDGVLHLSEGHLRVVGAVNLDIERADLAAGWFVEPDELHVQNRVGDEITLVLDRPAAGPRLLRSLGLGPRQRALRVPLAALAERFQLGDLVAATAVVLGSPALLISTFYAHYIATDRVWHHPAPGEISVWSGVAAALALVVAFALLSLRRGEATIGTDGISVRTCLRRAFYRYSSVGEVRAEDHGVHLDVGSPLSLELGAWDYPGSPAFDELRRQHAALASRIEDARAARSDSDASARPELDRADRSVRAWRTDLAKLSDPRASYRKTPLGADDLAAVVEDGAAPPERRVAAAVVLSSMSPDRAALAVSAAIDATADDGLRAALARAADGELDTRALRRG